MPASEVVDSRRNGEFYSPFSDREFEMLRDTWPLEFLEDPAKQPRVVTTVHEFLRQVLLGDHLGDFVLLRNGIDLLDLQEEDCLPKDILELFEGSETQTVVALLNRFMEKEDMLQKYKASIQYIDERGEQRGILPKERTNFRKRVEEIQKMLSSGKVDPKLLYIAEMRLQKRELHPFGGEKTKTICQRDLKDIAGPYAAWTLYWDRFDEGIFVGGAGSGKGVHVDQVLWSNIGKNWRGYKLVAAWPIGDCSREVMHAFRDQLFSPPIGEVQRRALQRASKVVLVRPGDVFLFSGGTAHTVICISQCLSVTAYESIVSLHPVHVKHFLCTSEPGGPYTFRNCMDVHEVEGLKDDIMDQLEDACDQMKEGGLEKQFAHEKAPSKWIEIVRQLHADASIRQALSRYYAQSVDLCTQDKYIRKHLSKRVRSLVEALRVEHRNAALSKKRRTRKSPCERT